MPQRRTSEEQGSSCRPPFRARPEFVRPRGWPAKGSGTDGRGRAPSRSWRLRSQRPNPVQSPCVAARCPQSRHRRQRRGLLPTGPQVAGMPERMSVAAFWPAIVGLVSTCLRATDMQMVGLDTRLTLANARFANIPLDEAPRRPRNQLTQGSPKPYSSDALAVASLFGCGLETSKYSKQIKNPRQTRDALARLLLLSRGGSIDGTDRPTSWTKTVTTVSTDGRTPSTRRPPILTSMYATMMPNNTKKKYSRNSAALTAHQSSLTLAQSAFDGSTNWTRATATVPAKTRSNLTKTGASERTNARHNGQKRFSRLCDKSGHAALMPDRNFSTRLWLSADMENQTQDWG